MARAPLLVLLVAACGPLASLAQDIGCFVPGQCAQSTEIGISFPADANGCLSDCQANSACFYFTFEFADDICVQFTECDSLTNTLTNETVSGHASCNALVCGDDGENQGTLLDVEAVTDEAECIDACVSHPECTWWSFYDATTPYCILDKDSLGVSSSCTDCTYGQRECREGAPATNSPLLNVTTASPITMSTLLIFGDDNEVDVVSLEGKTCDPVNNLPVSMSYTYSFTVDNGKTPVACYQSTCYSYDGSTWVNIDGPASNRYQSAGAQIDGNTYWAFGGYYADTSGETYDHVQGAWRNDPDPGEELYKACGATLDNRFVYYGGDYSTGSGYEEFYVLDWDSQTSVQLEYVPYGHVDGLCGITQTANDGPEFVIAGDYDYINVYNINDKAWRTEGSISSSVTGAAYVQFEDTFLYMGGSLSRNIFEWDSASNSFVTRTEEMPQVRTSYPSAVIIDGTILNCR